MLAQLRVGKCPLRVYLNKINPDKEKITMPIVQNLVHNTHHIFTCKTVKTHLTPKDVDQASWGVEADSVVEEQIGQCMRGGPVS